MGRTGRKPDQPGLVDLEQFHLKNERAVRRNGRRGAVGPVGQIPGNLKFEFLGYPIDSTDPKL